MPTTQISLVARIVQRESYLNYIFESIGNDISKFKRHKFTISQALTFYMGNKFEEQLSSVSEDVVADIKRRISSLLSTCILHNNVELMQQIYQELKMIAPNRILFIPGFCNLYQISEMN